MSKQLHLAPGLELPLDVVTQKLAFLGRTGSGKTYGATKLAELMLEHDAQIVVLDVVGVWYGLRIGGDFKLPVFGGLHGDIALESTAGAVLADLVVDRGISAVLDVSQFETDAQKARFAEAFASRFFFRKKAAPSAVHLFLEECQEFVPQNPSGGDAQMLHAWTRLAKLGRNFGIGLSLISQRPQEVNKKVLNMTEVMFAFQMRGPQERKTIKDWSSDKDLEVDIIGELPSLAVGEAFVSSPQWLQVEKRVKIAKKLTADVSSTPKVGATSTPAAARELTPIDLAQLQKTMAATIEKAKATDPRELQKEIARLRTELTKSQKAGQGTRVSPPDPAALQAKIDRAVEAAVTAERKQARWANEGLRRRLADVLQGLGTRIPTALVNLDNAIGVVKASLTAAIDGIEERLVDPAPPVQTSHAPRVVGTVASSRSPRRNTDARNIASTNGDLSGLHQSIVNALAELEAIEISEPSREQVGFYVGKAAGGGYFTRVVGELNTTGHVMYPQPGRLALTDTGRSHASRVDPPISLDDLHNRVRSHLSGLHKAIFDVVLEKRHALTREELGVLVGKAAEGGYFTRVVGELKTAGVLDYPTKGSVIAADTLFPEALS